MYFIHHYVIDWDRVQSVDDLKRLLRAMNITFERTVDVKEIGDLLKLEEKTKHGIVYD